MYLFERWARFEFVSVIAKNFVLVVTVVVATLMEQQRNFFAVTMTASQRRLMVVVELVQAMRQCLVIQCLAIIAIAVGFAGHLERTCWFLVLATVATK